MNLYLVAPFTTDICFDRKWIAYAPEKVKEYFGKAAESLLQNEIRLGHWLLPIPEYGRFYLDTEEPGEMFRSYFLAESQIALTPVVFPKNYPWLINKRNLAPPTVRVQWLDRGFGCLFATVTIDDGLIEAASEATLREFDRSLNELADVFYSSIFSDIQDKTLKLKSVLYIQTTPELNRPDFSGGLSKNLLWVHKIWNLPRNADKSRYNKLISNQTLSEFLPDRGAVWGWGDSILIGEDTDYETNSTFPVLSDWLRGMLLAQYFHTILDQSLKQLPHCCPVKTRTDSIGC